MEENPQAARPDTGLFYDAFKASPIGIALEDLEGRPLYVNPALCSMLGFSEEELRQKHCVEFSPPEDAQKDWALFEQLRAGSINHYSLEKRFFRRDGSLLWGRLTISLLNSRQSPLVVAMVEDVTEKKTAQETLELATKQMAAVARCSRDFRYVWANQGLADFLRRRLDEIVGRHILDVLGTETVEALRPHFERVLAGEKVTYEEEVNYRDIGRRWISATYLPTLDPGGAVDGWIAVILDVTERRCAEEALRRSEGYLAEAQRLAHSGSWALDVRTGDAFWSQEMFRILGYDREKTKPSLSRFLARIHPEDRLRVEQAVKEETTGSSTDVVSDYRIVLPDGTIKHLHAIAHPVINESGEVVEVVGTSMDVTERKLAEEALSTLSQRLIEAQEEERTRIARELHDDINQRLALLAVNLDRLKQDLPPSEHQTKRRIEEANRHVRTLGSDIQALSHRLHSSKLEYMGLAAASASLCRELSERQNVQIDFHSEDIPNKLPPEVALCLFRVLQEALHNAVRHSGARRFKVSLTSALSEIQLTVHDSGVGFDPEKAVSGQGLGLTSMRERLKLVDGQLSIDSKLRGGTTIQARIPMGEGGEKSKSAMQS
jgi:PAS domain S-box-containing protein